MPAHLAAGGFGGALSPGASKSVQSAHPPPLQALAEGATE